MGPNIYLKTFFQYKYLLFNCVNKGIWQGEYCQYHCVFKKKEKGEVAFQPPTAALVVPCLHGYCPASLSAAGKHSAHAGGKVHCSFAVILVKYFFYFIYVFIYLGLTVWDAGS